MSEIVISKADNASVLPLCETSGCALEETFEQKDSIEHTTLCPIRKPTDAE